MMRYVVVVVGILVLAGCGAKPTETIVLTGSSTVSPVMTEIAQRFEERHPGVRVDVHSGGSSRGIADLRQGANQVGMISRELGAEEQDLTAIPLASDGICLIVHQDNPIAELSADQVRQIYTGAITDWSAVGGQAGPIVVVNKDTGRATLTAFCKHFGLDENGITAQVVIGENAEGIKTVAGNAKALGYVSIGAAEKERALGTPIRLLPLAGVPATSASLADGSWPATRRLNLVVKQPPSGTLAALITFATSAEVHDIIKRQQFVPLAP